AKLPLYTFKRMKNRMNEKESVGEMKESPVAFLDSLLLGEWEDRVQRGIFRYDVTTCETKVIPGEYGFIAQLNEGHHLKKRPTEFQVDKVLQPFDENKFNFTKVGQEEVLFQFEESDTDETQFFPSAPIDTEDSPNVVAINVSPIEYGHVLPRSLKFWAFLKGLFRRASYLLEHGCEEETHADWVTTGQAFATINHLHFSPKFYSKVEFAVQTPTSLAANLGVSTGKKQNIVALSSTIVGY
ncbi:hypothetical protein IFM89_034546, partial [Coptis chinensis]